MHFILISQLVHPTLSLQTHPVLDDFTIILTLTSEHDQRGIPYKREDLASQGSEFFLGESEASDCSSLSHRRVKGDEGAEGGQDMRAIEMACYAPFG
jgi:hypothetical protein